MKRFKFTPNTKGIIVLVVIAIVVMAIAFRKRKTLKKVAMNTINYIKEKTWDIVSDRRIDTLHPAIQAKVKEFIIRAEKELDIKLRVTSGLRTWEEQTALFAKGRTSPGQQVTNAKAGQSYHNYGLAFDVVEIKNGKAIWKNPNWQRIGDLGKQLGFEWGGEWRSRKDKPHFQKTFGKHHSTLAKLYRSGQRSGEYVTLV